MKTSANTFLQDSVPSPCLAIFGKHPLAADHLEDIGLDTASLVALKKGMYINGIGECLSRRLWFKELGDTDAIPYDHHLFCVGANGWMAARLYRSADAAGRKQYPLVIAAHSGEQTLLHQIGGVASILEESFAAVENANSLQAFNETAVKSAERLASLAMNATPAPGAQARESWLQHMPGGTADREGLLRCCHALLPNGASAGRARLPLHQTAPWPSAILWASFLARMGVDMPLSILWRNGQSFADVWLAPPGARMLANLFSDISSQPLTTQVPFNIPPDLRMQCETVLTEWLKENQLFARPAERTDNSILNKVCHSLSGWFKPSTAE